MKRGSIILRTRGDQGPVLSCGGLDSGCFWFDPDPKNPNLGICLPTGIRTTRHAFGTVCNYHEGPAVRKTYGWGRREREEQDFLREVWGDRRGKAQGAKGPRRSRL